MTKVFFEGLFLQAGLIFAIGPQNIYVLESGLKKNHHLIISFICFICDFLLIQLGVILSGRYFLNEPFFKILLSLSGMIFLLYQSIFKFKSTMIDLMNCNNRNRLTLRSAILSSIFFSFLNPHSYIDALVLIGGYSLKYGDPFSRMILGVGAASFSLIWFLLLANIPSFLILFFKSDKLLIYISRFFSLLMLFFAFNLGLSVIKWTNEYLNL